MDIHDYGIDKKRRTIYLMDEEINQESSTRFIKNLDQLSGKQPITVKLATSGGDESCGLAMYKAMIDHSAPIVIQAAGEICSIGVLLLQGGDKRIISATTSLMYHIGTVGALEGPPEEMMRDIDNQASIGNLVDDIIHAKVIAKTGKTRKQYDDMVKASFFLIGQEIVDLGLADRVK